MTSAELALSGIVSVVDFDEAVEAMYNVGRMMHPNLRETALGGIAITETGLKLSEKVHNNQK